MNKELTEVNAKLTQVNSEINRNLTLTPSASSHLQFSYVMS